MWSGETVLPARRPLAAGALLDFLAHHVVPGVETAGPGWYARTLDLPGGPGTVRVRLVDGEPVRAAYALGDEADRDEAVRRTRRLLALGDDPRPAEAALGADPHLGPLVHTRPGLRVPGPFDGGDGAETAVRTVVGQQISVVGARTVTGRMVRAHGRPVETGVLGLTHLFPTPAALAAADPVTLPMPRARGRAVVGLAAALADGGVVLDPARPEAARAALLALPGIGPWTADYVAIRVLRDPDAFLPTDLGVRTALRRLGLDPAAAGVVSQRWRPHRAAALMHLWAGLIPTLDP